VGNKREAPRRRKREEEEILEMGRYQGSTVGIHAAVGVIVVLHESGMVVVRAVTARPLGEDGKQKRLHRRFRHLPRRSILQCR
jgi:hypothetical protein